ncbi:MAG: MarR family transcriptional regulator [Flavobacteriales bacterium]|nr:MarR family transcriptional regulator [Flavobacteriales bacterium]
MTKIADEEFSAVGLSSSHAFLIMSVNKKPGVNPKELAEVLQLTPSTVTRLIEKLEFKGFVERQQCGRCTEVFPTPTGMRLNNEVKEAWSKLTKRINTVLGEESCTNLTSAIGFAIQKLE